MQRTHCTEDQNNEALTRKLVPQFHLGSRVCKIWIDISELYNQQTMIVASNDYMAVYKKNQLRIKIVFGEQWYKFTSAKVSRYGHTSNLEIHLRRIPFSDLKGTRKMCECSVPLTFSRC